MLYNATPGAAGEGDLFLHAGLSNGVLQWTQVRAAAAAPGPGQGGPSAGCCARRG
jgi:hypothetical protein